MLNTIPNAASNESTGNRPILRARRNGDLRMNRRETCRGRLLYDAMSYHGRARHNDRGTGTPANDDRTPTQVKSPV